MSDAVSALQGASASGMVTLREMGLQGMVTLRADLETNRTAAAIKGATGADMPPMRGMENGRSSRIAWMSPDELLILCDHAEAPAIIEALSSKLGDAHHLAVNVSDARAMFELTGPGGVLRDVLAKVTPANMAMEALKPGEMRRTRLAQVPAAIWFEDAQAARVVCFRSVARYVFDLLAMSARDGGAVGYHSV